MTITDYKRLNEQLRERVRELMAENEELKAKINRKNRFIKDLTGQRRGAPQATATMIERVQP